jgi:Domain of unknown function (DUF4234)
MRHLKGNYWRDAGSRKARYENSAASRRDTHWKSRSPARYPESPESARYLATNHAAAARDPLSEEVSPSFTGEMRSICLTLGRARVLSEAAAPWKSGQFTGGTVSPGAFRFSVHLARKSLSMATRNEIPVFKNDPIIVLILGFVTCGLYLIYWNMKVAEVLNAISRREVISPVVAIVSGCCAPVNIYFYYLCGQSLGDLGRMIGKEEELKNKSTLLLILGIFFPMVSAMIVQGHINELYPEGA